MKVHKCNVNIALHKKAARKDNGILALRALEPAPLGDTPGKQSTLLGSTQNQCWLWWGLWVIFFFPL